MKTSSLFLRESWVRACTAGVLLTLGGALPAHASEALSKKYVCNACHHAERKLIGPSWREIAEKAASTGRSAEQLAAAISKGSIGQWGAVPMPAQPQVSPADLTLLANWIVQGGKP